MDNNQKKRERSVAYPGIPLEEAVAAALSLRTALGKAAFSREDAANALGYKGVSGASSVKVASLVHYGILNRTGNTYVLSELSERITHPPSEVSRTNAILEAVKAPKLYRDLINQFVGQALPTHLTNILVHKGISTKVAGTVASDFKKSIEFGGILKNGVVLATAEPSNDFMATGKIETLTNSGEVMPTTHSNNNQSFGYNDSGIGWTLSIKSNKPVSTKIKKILVDVTDLLTNEVDNNNQE